MLEITIHTLNCYSSLSPRTKDFFNTQRERAANTDIAQDLLNEEREQARQVKRMRKEQKAKTDIKLQEKLKRRKQVTSS